MGQGLYQSNTITTQSTANKISSSTLETKQGTVTNTYGTAKYVSAADVRIVGTTADLIQVPNVTGSILSKGTKVTINFLQGNSYRPQITGFAGTTSAALAAQTTSAVIASGSVNNSNSTTSSTNALVILSNYDPFNAPDGLVAEPGSNIFFNSVSGGAMSGGISVNGTFTITMKVLVGTSVPTSHNYLDGTLFDLIDSYGNGLGCYRFDATRAKWELRTPITGGGGGGTGTVTNVSVVTGNGVSGSVANSTTTPAISLLLGAITPTTVNGLTISTSTGTLTVASGKTLTANNTLTIAGTDSTTMTFPTTNATIARTDAAQSFTGAQTFNSIITTNNAVTVTSNAGTCPVTSRLNTFTNSSAATMAITIATASAVDGQMMIVRVYDFSGVAQTIGWTNTENSSVSVPTTSNGSTTAPLTVGFMYNSQTSKWRCIALA